MYLRPLDGEGKWQVTDGSGQAGRWSARGDEIYFLRPDARLGAVAIGTTAEPKLGRPRVLFDQPLPLSDELEIEVAPDGKRLRVVTATPETLRVPVRLVLHRPALLPR